MFKSSNPALGTETFINVPKFGTASETMTIQGTVNKTILLTLIVFGTSMLTWEYAYNLPEQSTVTGLLFGGSIGAFVMAILTIWKKQWAAVTAPLYAALEGVFLGLISAFMEMKFPGIVFSAILLTFGTLFALLGLYKFRIIRATENFKLIVGSATIGLGVFYMISMLSSWLFDYNFPILFGNSMYSIGFSVVICAIAALNLVMDFDFIEKGAEQNAPKYMEWYGAFGLMVTLIWLYIEILRLLSKIQSRD